MSVAKRVNEAWEWYYSKNYKRTENAFSGKWMHFFNVDALEYIRNVCIKSIEEEILQVCKHTSEYKLSIEKSGVICFYIDGMNDDQHRKVLKFMLDNGLIPRTKSGKLYNIAFKFDTQSRNGEYGTDFEAKINLSKYVDLETGNFI